MPFKKLPDAEQWNPPKACRHPEHNPPTMIVLQPGTYEWSCPACGHTVRVTVHQSSWYWCNPRRAPRKLRLKPTKTRSIDPELVRKALGAD